MLYDQSGNEVFAKVGQQHQVDFTVAEVTQMKGCILTHNHPAGGAPTFSPEDVAVASSYELAEIRAVSQDWHHSLRPSSAGWNAQYFDSDIRPSAEKHWKDLRTEFVPLVTSGKMTQKEAAYEMLHQLWVRVANELGLDYQRVQR